MTSRHEAERAQDLEHSDLGANVLHREGLGDHIDGVGMRENMRSSLLQSEMTLVYKFGINWPKQTQVIKWKVNFYF